MKYVFGPVPSRRLGSSLGIDTIPLKTCNWNCVYCQLGRTQPLTNQRKEYYPREEILAEVAAALSAPERKEIDWLTFVGSGEPLLHASMGWLLQGVKRLTDLPVAVITNGSLLYLPDTRQDLLLADAVLPTLDAGSYKLYRQINRPHPEATFERLVDGLTAFRREYSGKLWLEVMLIRGLNDRAEALWDLARTIQLIRPDRIHLNLPTRPPAETWVQPPDREALLQASAILGKTAKIVLPAMGEFDLSGRENVVEAILAIVARHPMRQRELERALNLWSPGEVEHALAELASSGQAQIVERYGERFWTASPAHFPEVAQSQRTHPGQKLHRHAQDKTEVQL